MMAAIVINEAEEKDSPLQAQIPAFSAYQTRIWPLIS
jgi:hypothetical protein